MDEAFALVPHHTIFSPVPSIPVPFLWNLATAHFFEGQLLKAAFIAPWVVALAKMLERLWPLRAMLSHVAFAALSTGFCYFAYQVLHVYTTEVRYRTHAEREFFAPVRGCSSLVVALAVGLRHAYPFETLPLVPHSWGLQCQHLPFAFAATITTVGLIFPKVVPEWPFAPCALFFGWLHIRYFMWFPYADAHGDHSPDFCFAALFPRPVRPLVSCLGAVTYSLGALFAPGFVKLREEDPAAGHAIMYDPVKAADVGGSSHHSPVRLSGSGGSNGFSDPESAREYDARRAKALQLLDDNINALLAAAPSKRAEGPQAKAAEVELATASDMSGRRMTH